MLELSSKNGDLCLKILEFDFGHAKKDPICSTRTYQCSNWRGVVVEAMLWCVHGVHSCTAGLKFPLRWKD